MSSLGDVIHTFPALTDAADKIPGLQIDWVVEEAFVEMPKWHPQVHEVIPIALRRWRKHLKEALQQKEVQTFFKNLRKTSYDYIIDAQGLMKSAIVSRLAKSQVRCGFDAKSARETVASICYQKRYSVDPYQPVVTSIRQLFAKSLGYELPTTEAEFGINLKHLDQQDMVVNPKEHYWVFLHGTSHVNKEWPVTEWIKLAGLAVGQGYKVYLPWGNSAEYERARQIAANYENVQVLPRLTINQIALLLSKAKAVVGLDTGFSHLAAAIRVPVLSIYRASDPRRVSITGNQQQYLEVVHKPSCKNATHSKVGIYDACHCLENLGVEQVFRKIIELSKS